MLINTWYVATESDSLSDAPLGVEMLGQPIALFRDKDGVAKAVSDICIHRGGSLSRGKAIDGTVQCPYHGWRFAGDGRCVAIPSLGVDAAIPKRARVDAYPTAERYGWVWVFLGDLSEEERPEVPDFFPEYDAAMAGDPTWRIVRGHFILDAAWTRVVENGLDNAHPFFVHRDFGNPDHPEIGPYEVSERPGGAYMTRENVPVEKRGVWAEKIDNNRPNVKTELRFHASGPTIRIQMHLKPPMNQIIVSAYLPINAGKTLSWWIHARNFFTDPKYDADTRARVLTVQQEDADIVNHIRPVQVPPGMADELSIYPDAMGVAFRTMIKSYEAKGWRIDTQVLAAEDDIAYAIPSPGRRLDPKNWVLDPVPLKTARA